LPREISQPSSRSLRGLDGINFLMADVRDGVGPYLSVFLKGGEHWDAGAIGVAGGIALIAIFRGGGVIGGGASASVPRVGEAWCATPTVQEEDK